MQRDSKLPQRVPLGLDFNRLCRNYPRAAVLMTGYILRIQFQQIFFPLCGLQGIQGDEILLPAGGIGLDENQKIFPYLKGQSFSFLAGHLAGKISRNITRDGYFVKNCGGVGVVH